MLLDKRRLWIFLCNLTNCSKAASEFGKDSVHTLYNHEIKTKFWPLPIRNLYGVGEKTERKLRSLNLVSIKDLALCDPIIIKEKLKSYGLMLHRYSWGIENSPVRKSNFINVKGMGNSTTTCFDVETKENASLVIMALTETIGTRLRSAGSQCNLVSINIRYADFIGSSKQRKLSASSDLTYKIYSEAYNLFLELWNGKPVRHIGVSVSALADSSVTQVTMFDEKNIEKKKSLDKTIGALVLINYFHIHLNKRE